MRLEPKIPTRMGDGSLIEMTRSQIKADLEDGTQFARPRKLRRRERAGGTDIG